MNGYIHGENRFFFLMAFIDVFTRKVIDYHIGLKCTAGDIIITLQTAVEKSGADIFNPVIKKWEWASNDSSYVSRPCK